jgi:tRNA pseudouridine38-40 synthase
VQEELERALHTVLGLVGLDGEPLALTVAGRTDSGVHAWGQVASYRHEALDPARLNGLLPSDVAVLGSEPMSDGFDARRDARSRTYCYRVLNRRTRSAFLHDRALWWPRALDVDALAACAEALVGRHDFTAFTPTETDHVRFERDVLSARWDTDRRLLDGGRLFDGGRLPDDGCLLEFWIEADTFMRHMNRVLVGTMLEVATGRRSVDDFTRLLEGCPRAEAGPTAPPLGLALASVRYAEGEEDC